MSDISKFNASNPILKTLTQYFLKFSDFSKPNCFEESNYFPESFLNYPDLPPRKIDDLLQVPSQSCQ